MVARKKKTAKKRTTPKDKWVRKVTTDSTHPPEHIFQQDAETIGNCEPSDTR